MEFDPGMVGKGVLVCCMTSLRKWSIEKEIVREVARGNKHYLRKSADRKAQISNGLIKLSGLICVLQSADFLR